MWCHSSCGHYIVVIELPKPLCFRVFSFKNYFFCLSPMFEIYGSDQLCSLLEIITLNFTLKIWILKRISGIWGFFLFFSWQLNFLPHIFPSAEANYDLNTQMNSKGKNEALLLTDVTIGTIVQMHCLNISFSPFEIILLLDFLRDGIKPIAF